MSNASTRLPRHKQGMPDLGRRHLQRGVIGVMAPATLLLALLFMVLTVDTGRLWLEKRRVQKTADLAAMASARYTGCGSDGSQVLASAQAVSKLNGLDTSQAGTTLTAERGYFDRDTQGLTVFHVQDTEDSNATHVVLTHEVPASLLMGGMFGNKVTLTARATAQGGPPAATFSVNSFMGISDAMARNITGMFKGILGNTSLDLSRSALTDLAGSTVNLVKLQAAAGADTIDELLNRRVPVSDLLRWIGQSADTTGGAATSLSDIYDASLSSGLTVRIGDVLNVQIPASSSVAYAKINVLDLVQTSLMVGAYDNSSGANKGVINFDLGLGSGTSFQLFNVSLKMFNPPMIAVGPAGTYKTKKNADNTPKWCTEAKSSQFKIIVAVHDPLSLVNLGVVLELGAVQADLNSLSIAPGHLKGVIDTSTTVANIRLRNSTDTGPATFAGSGLGLISIGLTLPLFESKGGTAPFDVPSKSSLPKPVQTQGVGANAFSGLLGPSTSLDIRFLFGIFKVPDLLANTVTNLVHPILQLISDGIIAPLLNALGFDIGLVKVQLLDVSSTMPILRE